MDKGQEEENGGRWFMDRLQIQALSLLIRPASQNVRGSRLRETCMLPLLKKNGVCVCVFVSVCMNPRRK